VNDGVGRLNGTLLELSRTRWNDGEVTERMECDGISHVKFWYMTVISE
jgi:hypothetical protein